MQPLTFNFFMVHNKG